jgi:hypothetical protein
MRSLLLRSHALARGALSTPLSRRPRALSSPWFLRTMSSATDRFYADKDAPFCSLNASKSFKLLTQKEKLYAHYVGQASWAGARIIQGQWTPQVWPYKHTF